MLVALKPHAYCQRSVGTTMEAELDASSLSVHALLRRVAVLLFEDLPPGLTPSIRADESTGTRRLSVMWLPLRTASMPDSHGKKFGQPRPDRKRRHRSGAVARSKQRSAAHHANRVETQKSADAAGTEELIGIQTSVPLDCSEQIVTPAEAALAGEDTRNGDSHVTMGEMVALENSEERKARNKRVLERRRAKKQEQGLQIANRSDRFVPGSDMEKAKTRVAAPRTSLINGVR